MVLLLLVVVVVAVVVLVDEGMRFRRSGIGVLRYVWFVLVLDGDDGAPVPPPPPVRNMMPVLNRRKESSVGRCRDLDSDSVQLSAGPVLSALLASTVL